VLQVRRNLNTNMRPLKNKFSFHRRLITDLIAINSHEAYHEYLISEAISRYSRMRLSGSEFGTVLAVCANRQEAEYLSKFPFERIVLSGIDDLDHDGGRLRALIEKDSRLSYRRENCENLGFESRSFDLVFCKEGLHHLSRPVQGLYEMLRTCQKAAIFIETYDCAATRLLEALGLTTYYERNSDANLIESRDNFVFRWSKRQLMLLLNSYYIDSGYEVDITLGWMSGRLLHDRPMWLKAIASSAGGMIGMVPGCRGNFGTVMITPGQDLPVDPDRFIAAEPT
jgi:SAM-dependent methyltransferase